MAIICMTHTSPSFSLSRVTYTSGENIENQSKSPACAEIDLFMLLNYTLIEMFCPKVINICE